VIFNGSGIITITRRETKRGVMASQEVTLPVLIQTDKSKYIIGLLAVQGLEHNFSAARLSSLFLVLMSPNDSFHDMYA